MKVDDSVDNALAQIDGKGYITLFISMIGLLPNVVYLSEQRDITHWRIVDVEGNILDERKA